MSEDKKKLILNLNIPFCVKQCSYCSYAYCAYDPQVLRAYGKALLLEIDSCAGEYPDYEVQAISVEGGSPALLGADLLSQALHKLRNAFSCADDLQISLQTMPGDYSRALMERMRDAGVNFWIIGLQTAQLREHEVLERPYHFDAITMADMAIRTFLPRALSFDLLAGIPGQTVRSLEQNLERCLYYEPDHITVYPLSIHPGSRLEKRIASGELPAVSGQNMEELCGFAEAFLKEHGFRRYTAYDYTRRMDPAGKSLSVCCVNRYRLLYLQDTEYLGIGYHGTSCIDGCMWQNGHSLQEYIDHPAEIEITADHLIRPDEDSMQSIRRRKAQLLVP